MKKLIFVCLFSIFTVFSCTSADMKVSTITKDEVLEIAQKELINNYSINVPKSELSIHKKGYGEWRITYYGMKNPYIILIDEEGNVISSEKKDYVN